MNDIAGMAEILIGKQRHGPTGNIQVEFEGMYTKFKDLKSKIKLFFFNFFCFKIYHSFIDVF